MRERSSPLVIIFRFSYTTAQLIPKVMRKLFGEKLPRVSFDDCERAKRAKRPLSTLVEIAPLLLFHKAFQRRY